MHTRDITESTGGSRGLQADAAPEDVRPSGGGAGLSGREHAAEPFGNEASPAALRVKALTA